MLNDTHLMGRLTDHIKLQESRNHVPFVFFSLAVKKDFAGEDKDLVDFIPITAWGKTAKYLSGYFKKGDIAVVQASIRNKVRNGKRMGNEIEIVAEQVWHGGSSSFRGNRERTQNSITDDQSDNGEDADEGSNDDDLDDDHLPVHR